MRLLRSSLRPAEIARRGLLLAFAIAGLVGPETAVRSWAQESIQDEMPTPSTVGQSVTEIERSFTPRPPPASALFPELREKMGEVPAFFRDAQIRLNPRSYYRKKTDFDDSKLEAWAGGGAVNVQSGWLLDALSIGIGFYTSQPLYAPEDRDGTQLLQEGQRGYASLGQLYARVKVMDDHRITLGRATYDTPYLSRNDGRMSPNTFEGYVLQGSFGGADGDPSLKYGGGYITKIKERNASSFVSMSRDAGADVDRGVAVAGGVFSVGKFSIGAVDYYSSDIINIGYGETKIGMRLPAGVDAIFAAQYVDQRSVDGNFLTGSSFATDQVGLRAQAGRDGAILTVAFSVADDGAKLQNPWSGNPFYTDSMIHKFNRAGEQAGLIKASYDFSELGLAGVTAYVLHARGRTSAVVAGPVPISEKEYDFDVQWRPQVPGFNGFWLRARYGFANVDEGGTRTSARDLRLILNYDVLLF